jgi:hypothetical protein
MILRNDNIFRLGTTGSNSKNSLAAFPRAHFLANSVNLTSKLQSGNVLRVTRWRRIVAYTLIDVRAIQPCGTHAYAHSIRCRPRWSFDFTNLKSFNSAMGGNRYGFHAMNGKS